MISPPRFSRRGFLRLGAVGAASAAVGDTLLWEPLFPRVTSVDVTIPGLPASFEGFRILQLTDFHHSVSVPLSLIERAAEIASDWPADMIALTGDFVTSPRFQWADAFSFVEPCVRALSGLRAQEGVFAVLGNHDHEVGADGITRSLERAGIRTLRDDGLRIERGGSSIWLGGVEDYWRGRDPAGSLGRALAGRHEGETSLLLAHQPDQWFEFVDRGVSLALCGHTHGGQIRFPFSGAPFVPSRYGQRFACGLFQEGLTSMFVSKGVGTFLIPARLLCRSEVVRIVMRAG